MKIVLPAIRRELARILHDEFGWSQIRIAKALCISQSAVSHYLKDLRGKTIDLRKHDDIMTEIRTLAKMLAQGESQDILVRYFCKICSMIFMKGLVCEAHATYVKKICKKCCEICKKKARVILEQIC